MYELYIYDDIGPDWMGMVSAQYVNAEIAKAKNEPITVRINSPGGDVFEGQAIYNALARRGNITIEIDALAASAASYIAMAGDKIRIAENAMVMIHNAWTMTMGDKHEHQKRLELLDKVDSIIAETYQKRIGDKSTPDKVREWMDAETWMTAKEAVERGFATEISQPMKVSACLKEGRYKNAPQAMLNNGVTQREIFRDVRISQAKIKTRLTNAMR